MEIINYLKRVNGSGHIVEHVGWHESGDYLLRLLFDTSEKPFRQHKYEVEKEYTIIDKSEVDLLERQTCGRRMQDFGPWERENNLDHWSIRNGQKTCSFCGSINPMSLLEAIKTHGFSIIEKTDKSYKWYVSIPGVYAKYYRHHDTPEFINGYNALIDDKAKKKTEPEDIK